MARPAALDYERLDGHTDVVVIRDGAHRRALSEKQTKQVTLAEKQVGERTLNSLQKVGRTPWLWHLPPASLRLSPRYLLEGHAHRFAETS